MGSPGGIIGGLEMYWYWWTLIVFREQFIKYVFGG